MGASKTALTYTREGTRAWPGTLNTNAPFAGFPTVCVVVYAAPGYEPVSRQMLITWGWNSAGSSGVVERILMLVVGADGAAVVVADGALGVDPPEKPIGIW